MKPIEPSPFADDLGRVGSSLSEPRRGLDRVDMSSRPRGHEPLESVLRGLALGAFEDDPGERSITGPGDRGFEDFRAGQGSEVARVASPEARSGGAPESSAKGTGRDADATVTRLGIDLRSAAASYLWSRRAGGGGLAEGWDLSPGDRSESGRLFVERHRTSTAEVEQLARGLTPLPEPGQEFLGFHLVEELGRGAFGRVYLAQQGDLADRYVALKVSTELPGESQTLAQLQHTNIVPIFSAHQAGPLHAVCMPYFGRATLADLMDDVEHQESLPDSGKALLKTLGSRRSGPRPGSSRGSKPGTSRPAAPKSDRPPVVGDPGSVAGLAPPGEEPAPPAEEPAAAESETLRTIGNLSYVGAVLWMGVRIADGLAHAHGRGILHRDLKPANVLLTDDGQPMILDFNLSENTNKPDTDATSASVGGTLPYMSPEHMERFLGGQTEPDARSDLYALGVMLFELLTGRRPFEVYSGHSIATIRRMIQDRKAGPPGPRALNPAITPAVESIVKHCLEPDPSRRYRSAAELHEDLERHLADLPLRHAAEPSIRERAGKWARRHPRLGSSTTIVAVAMALVATLSGALVARGGRLARLEASRDLSQFVDEATAVRFLLNHRTDDRARRARGQSRARQALGRFGVLDDPGWSDRPAVAQLRSEDQLRLREEVSEVLLMLTQATAMDAAQREDLPGRRDLGESARRLGQIAMATFPGGHAPQAFWAQQAALARLLGREDDGARMAAEAEKLPLRTARDYYLSATSLALRGDHAKALPLAEEATRIEPRDFWSWFVLGVCQDHLEHHPEAMACFTTCIALRPDFADSWFNRGLAYLKRSDLDRARADFDRAARLRPDWYEPPLNRALVHRELGEHRRAENDLSRALELGAPETRVYFLRAAAREKLGDRDGARLDRQEGLKREPTDVASWLSRGMARMGSSPQGALDDFAAALKLDPRSLPALQMSAYVLSDLPGRDQDTITMLDQAVALHPDFVPVRSGRGVQHAILGHREEALRDARESVWRDTSPAILYQVAGIYATTSRTHPEDKLEAYRLLAGALRAGFGFELIAEDHELDPIRNEPEFRAVVDSARAQARQKLHRPSGR